MNSTEIERKAYALLQANIEAAQALGGLLSVLEVVNEFSRNVSDAYIGSGEGEFAAAYVTAGTKRRRKQLAALKPTVPLVAVKGKPSAREMKEFNSLVAVKRAVAKTTRKSNP